MEKETKKAEDHLAPRLAPLQWIARIDPGLHPEVAYRLRRQMFHSPAPIFLGTLSVTAVCLFAYGSSNDLLLLALGLGSLVLGCLRAWVLINQHRLPYAGDFLHFGGLLWTAIIAMATLIIVHDGDLSLIVVVLGTGLATAGGIISTNFSAPRYALAQVLLVDLSFKIPFIWEHPKLAPLLIFQFVLFMMANLSILKRQRETTVQAISAELARRDQAFTDPLTGVLNRRGFEDVMARRGDTGSRTALFCLDLDGFKGVNDRYGHGIGDQLLQQVAARLRETAPQGAVCRLGGDEFLVSMTVEDEVQAKEIGTGFVIALGTPYAIDGQLITSIGSSVGIALLDPGEAQLMAALARADSALYRAKAMGKGRALLFQRDPAEDAPEDAAGHAA